MRRIFCAICLLALLAGCAPAGSAAPLAENESSAVGEPLALVNQSTNGIGYFSLYYDSNSSNPGTLLTRWDFGDMTMHIVCSAPNCDHTSETCEARSNGYPLVVLEDAIYTLEYAPDLELYPLMVRDADGTHPRQVGALAYWFFVGADAEYLYGFCDGAFGRVSRTNGTETFLAHGLQDDFFTSGKVLGIWQDRFVAINWDISSEQPARICLLDRSGDVTEIAQVDPTHFCYPMCILIENEVMYLDRPTGDIVAIHLETGETRTVTQALRSYNALETQDFYKTQRWYLQNVQDHPIVEVTDFVNDSLQETVFCVNEDGSVSELPQRQEMRGFDEQLYKDYYNTKDAPLTVLAEWDDQLVVNCAVQFSTIDTVDGPVMNPQSVYAVMDAEDYLVGKEIYREFTVPD